MIREVTVFTACLDTMLSLLVANIPSNMYECVFNYANTTASSVTMATMINETHINCSVTYVWGAYISRTRYASLSHSLFLWCEYKYSLLYCEEYLSSIFSNTGTLFVALSLRTTSTDVVTVGGNTFGFTDCTVLRRYYNTTQHYLNNALCTILRYLSLLHYVLYFSYCMAAAVSSVLKLVEDVNGVPHKEHANHHLKTVIILFRYTCNNRQTDTHTDR